MAKVISPLLSGKAYGQIMKSLVFFPWKSLNCVRGYVIPSNPNTSDQQAQRTKLTNAVDKWHDTALIDDDKTAWNLLASTFAEVMSGFNAFVKKMILAVIAGGTWKKFYNMSWAPSGATTCDVGVDTDDTIVVAKLYIGTSKTFMPTEFSSDGAGASQNFSVTGLEDGVTYYYWIRSGTSVNNGQTGIYKQKFVAP